MFFFVDPTVEVALRGVTLPSPTSHAVDLLGLAVSEGKHRLSGTRSVLRGLAQCTALQERTRAVLHAAFSFAENDLALKQGLSVYALIEASAATIPFSEMQNTQRVIRIPLQWIDDSSKVQATVLLAENLDDAAVLEKVVEVARHPNSEMSLPIRARQEPGGGQTTIQLYEHLAQQATFCLCVVDSDRKCPAGPSGGTAQALSHGNNIADYPVSAVVETQGRDLENTFPNRFYEQVYGDDVNHKRMVELLKTLTSTGEHELRMHFDIKKGLTLRDVFKLGEGSPARTFWNQKLLLVANACAVSLDHFGCYGAQMCAANAGACQCRVTSGNADNILRAFLTFCNGNDTAKIASELDDTVRPEWLRIARSVFEWCCAGDRLRS